MWKTIKSQENPLVVHPSQGKACLQNHPFKVPPPVVDLKFSPIARCDVKLADEIPLTDLIFSKKIGSGTSGQVYKGNGRTTDVAIEAIDIIFSQPKQILNEVSA
ncbi:hypothetical protein QAD02_011818 [Eretmocerus hayati]|uniref:Uncharacterized protein n=1 Tax=Eretmocerus hayati TaxID=131215 RepID=A0ACC2P0Q9_9HYME|nr:hypothetical protein QAD02_011818 [Eretmocerus hayati]